MKKRVLSVVMAVLFVITLQSNSVQAADYVSRSLVKLNAVYLQGSSTAVSNSSVITVSSSASRENAEITSIVITSSKSSASVGNLTLHVKNKTTGYSDSKAWAKSVTFTGLNGSNPIGSYEVYFTGSRTGSLLPAAATLSSATIKVYYE